MMDAKGNAANLWTAVLGLVAAIFTLLAAIGGSAGFFQGADTTADGEDQATVSSTATGTAIVSRTPTPKPSATSSPRTEPAEPTPTPTPTPAVRRQGTLELPVAGEDAGQLADFDTGELVREEKEEAARDADLSAREDGDEIVLEPGIVQPGGAGFYARFVMVGDVPAGRDGCAGAESGRGVSGSLRFPSEVEVGSHVCLVTTEGRLAEFKILSAKLTGRQRWIEVRYTTWAD